MANVIYKTFDGEQVSEQWYSLLIAIRKLGVSFHVNEGHRTMARQEYFWALYQRGIGPIAARPSSNAPHIRTGRFDHAIDFNGAEGVRQAARKLGVTLTRTVLWPNGSVREEWHLEANAAELAEFYARHKAGDLDPILHRGQVGKSVLKLKGLMRHNGLQKFNRYSPFFDAKTEAALKRFQHRHGLKADGIAGPATWRELR